MLNDRKSMKRKAVVLGGGTFSPIATHLSLCAPAFGNTAKTISARLRSQMIDTQLILTDMASDDGCDLGLRTNEDVRNLVETLLEDKEIGIIVMNVAFCDFKFPKGDRWGNRMKTEDGPFSITLEPDNEKVLGIIRKKRPDIFLVGFKTVTSPKESTFDEVTEGIKM
jgi:hypothetical protein